MFSSQHLEEGDDAEGLEVLLDGAPAHPQQLLLRLAHHHLKHQREREIWGYVQMTSVLKGGQPISDERKGGCVDLVLTGGRGSKILEI